jgi:hypothetical protein
VGTFDIVCCIQRRMTKEETAMRFLWSDREKTIETDRTVYEWVETIRVERTNVVNNGSSGRPSTVIWSEVTRLEMWTVGLPSKSAKLPQMIFTTLELGLTSNSRSETSMGWDDVSELLPLTDIFFISQMIYGYRERRWNDTDRGKAKNSEKNLSQCHSVHHKSHMDWPGREPGTPWWQAGD